MDSKIYIKTKYTGKKTVYDDVFFTPPYKIIAPLYHEDEAEIMILSSSAGLLGGDQVDMKLDCLEGSNVRITSQSYEKIFDTDGKKAKKKVEINVYPEAVVKYMPHPTIPFANSDYENEVIVNLSEDTIFCYSDIINCGRVYMGERFLMKRYENYFRVNVGGIPVLIDHVVVDPKQWEYSTIGLWHEYTHNGLLYLYAQGKEQLLIEHAREMGLLMLPDFEVGASLSKKGVCIRVLGDSGERISEYFQELVRQL